MSTELAEKEDDWVGMWDRENPKSVWNRVPTAFRVAMDSLPDKVRNMGEGHLFRYGKPSLQVQDARQRFWELFQMHETKNIQLRQVFNGSPAPFYNMTKNPHRLMWFLTPPADLRAGQKAMLERTMNLIRDSLREDNLYTVTRKVKKLKDGTEEVEETKELNTKAMAEVRKLMGEMTDRVDGTAVQRVAHAVHHSSDPLANLISAGTILEVAEDDGLPLEPAERVQNNRYDHVDEKEVIEAHIADFMSDDSEDEC